MEKALIFKQHRKLEDRALCALNKNSKQREFEEVKRICELITASTAKSCQAFWSLRIAESLNFHNDILQDSLLHWEVANLEFYSSPQVPLDIMADGIDRKAEGI